MVAKFQNTFSNSRSFRDITKKRPDIVQIVKVSQPNDVVTKIYECKDTIIIYSKSSKSNHASISHAKGYVFVQEWEIAYAINRILKVKNEDVIMHVGGNGVIHLRVKEESLLKN